MGRHAVSLIICTDDLSSAPENIFTSTHVRTLSFLKSPVGFDYISLWNPVVQCIEMVIITIRQLKLRHSDLGTLIKGLENLLVEMEEVNLKTHKAIEPSGSLVMSGIKNCLHHVHPLIEATNKLPDSMCIRTAKNRLEWTVFILSAFFSKLSTNQKVHNCIARSNH